MIEYISGRDPMDINDLQFIGKYSNKFFVNQRPDALLKAHNLEIKLSTFVNMGFSKSEFTYSKFTLCVFIDCYFRNAKLEMSDFTGCKFINCSFENAAIIDCKFDYAIFRGTTIEYKTMKYNLPKERFNLSRDICRNLALENLRKGDIKEYKSYYFTENAASEKHYWEKIRQKDKWYKDHYSYWDIIVGTIQLTISKFNKYLWGYGEKISYLVRNMFLFILLFGLFYWKIDVVYKMFDDQLLQPISFLDSMYLSICNMFTVSPAILSSDPMYRWLSGLEGAFGLISIGFFTAAIFRNINRR